MKPYELKKKIINKRTRNLLKNYVLTIVNNKNEANKNLKPEDLNIIISSGNGRKKKIFSSLFIVNACFDPETYCKKNLQKYNELNNLIEPLDEEGINPYDEFEEIDFNLTPKLSKGLYFNLNAFDFMVLKESEEMKTFDKNFFDSKYDNKKLFCIYTTKLGGKRHKFNKIIKFVETVADVEKEFFQIFKKILIIFEVKNKDQIEQEFMEFPMELRDMNENRNFKDFQILFNIKKENDDNSPSDIFGSDDFGKTLYFILNKDNIITKVKSFYSPESLVKETIEKYNKYEKNPEINNLQTKINACYDFIDFLNNIKSVQYYFYLNYNFSIVLNYDENEDKFIIKNAYFSRLNGEFRHAEYKKLNKISSLFPLDYQEFNEIKSIDIDIDFTNMKCIICSKIIQDEEELFYCYICKDKYCFNCVKEHMENNTGKDKFIDQKHNLLFFKTRDKNNFCALDEYKLGKNTFANSDEENLGRFKNVQCNGCAVQFATSARYICITCRPGLKRMNDGYNDYCQNCIEHMMQNDQKGKEIQNHKDYIYNTDITLLSEDYTSMRHIHKDHIYLLVPLASNDEENPYYDY